MDTGTSGLVLIAKTPEAEQILLEAIKERQVKKTYLCVTFGRPIPPEGTLGTFGRPIPPEGTLGGYLLKDASLGKVQILPEKKPGAKEVCTEYETIAVSGRLALLKVRLITGRTHQIRAHMASIGCPILLKYQALCAWELVMPGFSASSPLAEVSGKTFHAPRPWYYGQILDGTLK